jgi:hypothetical protein
LSRLGVGDERQDPREVRLNRERMLDLAIGLAELDQAVVCRTSGDDQEDGRQREADYAQTPGDHLLQ